VNRDQFKRPWLVSIELETGEQTGLITTAGGRSTPCWEDPLRTPQKYMVIPAESPREIFIDFRRWYRDAVQARRDHARIKNVQGRKLYGEKFDESAPITGQLLEDVGAPPMDPVLIKRASLGDRGLLGFEPLSAADRTALGFEEQQRLIDDLGEIPDYLEDREDELDPELEAAQAAMPADLDSTRLPSRDAVTPKAKSAPARPVRPVQRR
jgi:hypothetical protein